MVLSLEKNWSYEFMVSVLRVSVFEGWTTAPVKGVEEQWNEMDEKYWKIPEKSDDLVRNTKRDSWRSLPDTLEIDDDQRGWSERMINLTPHVYLDVHTLMNFCMNSLYITVDSRLFLKLAKKKLGNGFTESLQIF